MLGLPKHASNDAALGECGRVLLASVYFMKCIQFWLKVIKMPNTRYVKCCYNMVKTLDDCNRLTWATSIRLLLSNYGFDEVWRNQGVGQEQVFLELLLNWNQKSIYSV